jgi:hypothetical protein
MYGAASWSQSGREMASEYDGKTSCMVRVFAMRRVGVRCTAGVWRSRVEAKRCRTWTDQDLDNQNKRTISVLSQVCGILS